MSEKKSEKKVEKREQIIRFVETNLNGSLPINAAIRGIQGIGVMFSNAVSDVSGLGNKKLGELSKEELQKLENIIREPEKFDIPSWMLNRRKDRLTGKDGHLVASKLDLTKKMDINEMKKIKCYKGVRHSIGLPVRGQRTRSSFRKGKVVGVKRKTKKSR